MKPPIEYRKPRYKSVGPGKLVQTAASHVTTIFCMSAEEVLAHKRAVKAAQQRRWRANKKLRDGK